MNSYTFNFKYFLIIFLIIITSSTIIALLSIENFLKSNLVNNKSIIEYKSLFLNGKAPWLAFGDSHTANSLLNSSIINNLGYASDNLDSISKKSFYRIKRLKPKGIILQATPHTFSFYRLSDNQQQKTKFLIGDNKYFFEFLNPLHRPFLINYLELIIKNFLIDNRKKSFKEEKWIEKSMQNKNYETSTRVQLHMPISNFQNHFSFNQYSDLINSFIKADINVCLVRYPVSKFYLNKTKKIKAFVDLNNSLRDIANIYNVKFVDLSEILEEKYFADTDHITKESKLLVTNLVKKGCGIND